MASGYGAFGEYILIECCRIVHALSYMRARAHEEVLIKKQLRPPTTRTLTANIP